MNTVFFQVFGKLNALLYTFETLCIINHLPGAGNHEYICNIVLPLQFKSNRLSIPFFYPKQRYSTWGTCFLEGTWEISLSTPDNSNICLSYIFTTQNLNFSVWGTTWAKIGWQPLFWRNGRARVNAILQFLRSAKEAFTVIDDCKRGGWWWFISHRIWSQSYKRTFTFQIRRAQVSNNQRPVLMHLDEFCSKGNYPKCCVFHIK